MTDMSFENEKFSRRSGLKAALGVTAGMFLHNSENATARLTKETSHPAERAGKRVKEKEEALGNRHLSLHEAEELSPYLIDLYAESMSPTKTPEEFKMKSFIVVRTENSQDADSAADAEITLADGKRFRSSLIVDMHRRYPHLEMHAAMAEHLVQAAYNDSRNNESGITFDQGMFLLLDNINNPVPAKVGYQGISLAFDDIDTKVTCDEASSAALFRGTFHHESDHFDIDQFIKLQEGIYIKGFAVRSVDPVTKYILDQSDGLNELQAAYSSAKIATYADLPYVISYNYDPHQYKNYEAVLEAANLSHHQAKELHRMSDLPHFIGSLRNSSVIQAMDTSAQAYAFFALERALNGRDPLSGPDWGTIAQYVPSVDPLSFEYNPFFPAALPDQGCLPQIEHPDSFTTPFTTRRFTS